MIKKRTIEDPAFFDLFGVSEDEPLPRLPYRVPNSMVHEVTEKVWTQLSKIDEFQCLYQKCPLWLNPCF